MKGHIVRKGIYSSVIIFALTGSVFAGAVRTMAPAVNPGTGKFYVGVFGGGGSTSRFDVNQYGTAFFPEASGGPLAVDAFGHTKSRGDWLVGGQGGYLIPQIVVDANSQIAIAPALELEGYYLGKKTFTGDVINNTTRLPEHDFAISYKMQRSVFLANAVFNLNIPCVLFHPYVGAGFGGAVVKVTGADSTQLAPVELGVNHFNSHTSDTDATFAGQVKAGVSYDLNDMVSLFAEYRWLYLSSTHFTFGSTVYTTHAPTSSWQVNNRPQSTNMGTVGIRFNL